MDRVYDLFNPGFLNSGKRGRPFGTPNAFIAFLAKISGMFWVPLGILDKDSFQSNCDTIATVFQWMSHTGRHVRHQRWIAVSESFNAEITGNYKAMVKDRLMTYSIKI